MFLYVESSAVLSWLLGGPRSALTGQALRDASLVVSSTLTSAPFPCEPIRTLDAIHVASVSLVQDELGTVTVLSYDDRVRANAAALGMSLLPPAGP